MQDSYGNYESSSSSFLQEIIDEQGKIIEQQQFVLDAIKNWAYSEQEASFGYTKARWAVQELIERSMTYRETLELLLNIETDPMLKKERTNSFVDIRSEALSDSEKEGVEKLLAMALSLRQQVQLRSSFEKEVSRSEMPNGAKLCPFCAGEATMLPEGDYWEITCDDCGVFKQGSTYEQALNEWNLRRL